MHAATQLLLSSMRITASVEQINGRSTPACLAESRAHIPVNASIGNGYNDCKQGE